MSTGVALLRGRLASSAAVLIAAAICVRLGLWQLDRLEQRRTFNEHVKMMRALPALELPVQIGLLDQEYRSVRATGSYDFGHQIAIRNQVHEGQYGFHLLTPLRMEGTSSAMGDGAAATVLVDRGWIPAEGNESPADWRKYDIEGIRLVEGIIRQRSAAPVRAGQVQPATLPDGTAQDFWIHVDTEQIGQRLPYPILQVYIQESPSLDETSLPMAANPALDLAEGPHQGYAVQWFGFAAILVTVYLVYLKREASKT